MIKVKCNLDLSDPDLHTELSTHMRPIGKCGIIHVWFWDGDIVIISRQYSSKHHQVSVNCNKCKEEQLGLWQIPFREKALGMRARHPRDVTCAGCFTGFWAGNHGKMMQEATCRVKILPLEEPDFRTNLPFRAFIPVGEYLASLFSRTPHTLHLDNVGYYCHRCHKTDFNPVKCDCDLTKIRLILASWSIAPLLPVELRHVIYKLMLIAKTRTELTKTI